MKTSGKNGQVKRKAHSLSENKSEQSSVNSTVFHNRFLFLIVKHITRQVIHRTSLVDYVPGTVCSLSFKGIISNLSATRGRFYYLLFKL